MTQRIELANGEHLSIEPVDETSVVLRPRRATGLPWPRKRRDVILEVPAAIAQAAGYLRVGSLSNTALANRVDAARCCADPAEMDAAARYATSLWRIDGA